MIHGGSLPRVLEVSLPTRGPRLGEGERVRLRVIKPLAPGKWAVAVRGSVLPARTSMSLIVGQVLSARVQRRGQTVVLHLLSEEGDLGRLLSRAGLPHDALSRLIARSLMRFGAHLDAPTILRLRRLIRSGAGRAERRALLHALVACKLPDLEAEEAQALVDVLSYGEHGEGGREKRRRGPRLEIGLPVETDGEEAGGDALCLFNHAAPSNEHWVVVPYRFATAEGAEIAGTIRILYDTSGGRPRRLSLVARDPAGRMWGFDVRGDADRSCTVYAESSDVRAAAQERLTALRSNFNNMGVRIDDIIEDERLFDGFGVPTDAGASSEAGVVDTHA